MKVSTEHAWVLDVLRDLAEYANNHELPELCEDIVELRQQHEAPLLGKSPIHRRRQLQYRRDFTA